MEIYDLLTNLLGESTILNILASVATVIGLANMITIWFPSVKENKVYNFIMKILNWVSLNIIKNKNADET
jgi:uncharacterized protein YggT (Ycf19 family)